MKEKKFDEEIKDGENFNPLPIGNMTNKHPYVGIEAGILRSLIVNPLYYWFRTPLKVN